MQRRGDATVSRPACYNIPDCFGPETHFPYNLVAGWGISRSYLPWTNGDYKTASLECLDQVGLGQFTSLQIYHHIIFQTHFNI